LSTFGVNIKISAIIRSAVPILEQVIKKETAMEMTKILSDLRQEREQLEEAILTLERLGLSRGKRRGRPPTWLTETKKRGRPPGSKNKPRPPGSETAAS